MPLGKDRQPRKEGLMSRRGTLARWPIAWLLLVMSGSAAGLVAIHRPRAATDVDTIELYKRWTFPTARIRRDPGLGGRDPRYGALSLPPAPSLREDAASHIGDDLGLGKLKNAAAGWSRSLGPARTVIDQVCLVPDVPTFLEAIAAWDETHFFPILIDEPAWTLPFLRAFQPARVVRLTRRKPVAASDGPVAATRAGDRQPVTWLDGVRAVSRAWSSGTTSDGTVASGRAPAKLGPVPPGVVLTSPASPMFAGAVALAAGRFEPLIRFEIGPASSPLTPRFESTLTAAQAWTLALAVEQRVAALTDSYRGIGDSCDFLTIAGDWPYRYVGAVRSEETPGILAVDDLFGRALAGDPEHNGLARSRQRWAYAGRLVGDPAASVFRAMCSLFLQPSSALLWNTYGDSEPWNIYAMKPAAETLKSQILGSDRVELHSNPGADLNAWHRANQPASRFGFFMFNSTGGSRDFSITGGPGHPGDIPLGVPSVVSTIHSFSAAEPMNPETIAGRWLEQGAYAYYGSVNEPFVQAFRPPSLITHLIASDVPLVAAVRQGEYEHFGHPWRLIYLGDPLYRVLGQKDAQVSKRLPPEKWTAVENEKSDWAWSIVKEPASSPLPQESSAAAALAGCLDSAIRDASRAAVGGLAPRPTDQLAALERLDRDQWNAEDRKHYDQVLIDSLIWAGRTEILWTRLCRIAGDDRSARVWHVLEWLATSRLAKLFDDPQARGQFPAALDLWEMVMSEPWPDGSAFPEQFTRRLHALAANQPERLAGLGDRLARVSQKMITANRRSAQAEFVEAERARIARELER